MRLLLGLSLASSLLMAETLEEALEGFDDEPKQVVKSVDEHDTLMLGFEDDKPKVLSNKKKSTYLGGLTGRLTQQTAFSYVDDAPHNNFSSLKSSVLLDYEHKFENGFKFKTNVKGYYDAIYALRGREKYSQDELNELESEVELFDAYIEGSLSDKLDVKLGRQIVVWGRSDTIRITDVLNPLDNRRPGMVDIEDLRLPIAMAKFDYFVGDWRFTPIAILEQRFSKNPPAGSSFNAQLQSIEDQRYSGITPALSVGGEFSDWDINIYAANIRQESGYVTSNMRKHDKVKMFGTALNFLKGSWLVKGEMAYFDGLKYVNEQDNFSRIDGLVGFEYNGIVNTQVSYDVSLRTINGFTEQLKNAPLLLEENTYQHAFRVSSDFMNATLKGHYLVTLFGKGLDEGGFQRAWLRYDIMDGVYTNAGVVDYIGGSKRFDAIANNDMIFLDVSYSF